MKNFYSFSGGAGIGVLGGLIGLGGAEFRLPLLNIVFKFNIKDAILINLVVSLITVLFSFLFRITQVPFFEVLNNLDVVLNLLCGSLVGSYLGSYLLHVINEELLKKVVFLFLVFLGFVLMFHSRLQVSYLSHNLPYIAIFFITLISGFVIGVISSTLGVAGGELIIPTIIFTYGIDIKIAGTLSLLVSIPTILISLYKHKKSKALGVININREFVIYMALGSILGALIGSYLLGKINSLFLELFLGMLLIASAIKMRYLKKRA